MAVAERVGAAPAALGERTELGTPAAFEKPVTLAKAATVTEPMTLGNAAMPDEPATVGEPVTIDASELARLRELAAVGEQVGRFRHDLNNPLTALLTEAQLLELDAVDAATRATAGRIVSICRRVIASARALGASDLG